MLDVVALAITAVKLSAMEKVAVRIQRGRSGRNCKASTATKQLAAAGSPRQTVRGVIGYPRGRRV